MRKDYIVAAAPSDHETEFVENYWTQVWEREGGPKGSIKRIPRQDEYRLMTPYLSTLSKGARILDGGCGLGDWVLTLSQMGYDLVGVDLSRRTVEKLQERYPKVPFFSGDIRETEFLDNSFDAYYSWGVFEHFESGPQACLAEAWRLLKPEGLLFISVPLDNLRHSLLGSLSKPKSSNVGELRFYQYRFTRAELAKEINMAGFEVLSVRPIHKRQGLLRSLHHEFGMPFEWLLTKGLATVLAPIIPGWVIAHMVFAVARKPPE